MWRARAAPPLVLFWVALQTWKSWGRLGPVSHFQGLSKMMQHSWQDQANIHGIQDLDGCNCAHRAASKGKEGQNGQNRGNEANIWPLRWCTMRPVKVPASASRIRLWMVLWLPFPKWAGIQMTIFGARRPSKVLVIFQKGTLQWSLYDAHVSCPTSGTQRHLQSKQIRDPTRRWANFHHPRNRNRVADSGLHVDSLQLVLATLWICTSSARLLFWASTRRNQTWNSCLQLSSKTLSSARPGKGILSPHHFCHGNLMLGTSEAPCAKSTIPLARRCRRQQSQTCIRCCATLRPLSGMPTIGHK